MISIREPLVNTMNDYGGLGIVLEEAENENNLSNLSQQLKQQIQQKHTSISSRQSSIVSLSKPFQERHHQHH